MGGAGRNARRLVRAAEWAGTRRRWHKLVGLLLTWSTMTIAVVLMFHVMWRDRGFTGFVVGLMVASGAFLVRDFVGIAGNTLHRRFGIDAESWTYASLKKLPHKPYIANGLSFERWDVDHVVVTDGRVLAVESKWRSRDLPADPHTGAPVADERDIADARRGARKIRLRLHAAGVRDQRVDAVLVYWGPGAPRTADGWFVQDDVLVAIGAQARSWRKKLAQPIGRIERAPIVEALKSHQHAQRRHDRARRVARLTGLLRRG